jgi:predicted transcriptional regulator
MSYQDEVLEGDEVVRAFMATGGRTRARGQEFAVETMVSPIPSANVASPVLQFERQQIVDELEQPTAIVEIAAKLGLPLRAVQVLVSEMIGDGLLRQHATVARADSALLLRIRHAVAAL